MMVRIRETCRARSWRKVYRARNSLDSCLVFEFDLLERPCLELSSKGPYSCIDIESCCSSMAIIETTRGAFSHVDRGKVRDWLLLRCGVAYFETTRYYIVDFALLRT